MGTSNSKSTSMYCNNVAHFTNSTSGISLKMGNLDVSERQLLLEIRRIILLDEVLDYIVDRNNDALPPAKKKEGSQ